MNADILTLCLPTGKFILAATLMVIFYKLLYKEKTTFNHCRVYLLSIAFVSLLISQFNIVVYTPPTKIVEIEAQTSMPEIAPVQNPIPQTFGEKKVASNHVEARPQAVNSYMELLTLQNIAIVIYGLVTFLLFISLAIQYFKILSMKRKGDVIQKEGFEMVVNPEIPTPFSFLKFVFIGKNLSGNKLDMILTHEQWHIKHHHYVDVMVMEILVRIFWFNPILWWVRKELRNLSEFQADRSVLDEGHDLYKYQTIILEEVMEHNPYLANGFNNSFTKKRFIMMKNNYQIRFKALRRAMILPFLVGVFSLLCFTTGKGEIKYVTKNTEVTPVNSKIVLQDSLSSKAKKATPSVSPTSSKEPDSVTTTNHRIFTNKNTSYHFSGVRKMMNEEDISKDLNDISMKLSMAIKEWDLIVAKQNLIKMNNEINSVFRILEIKFSSQKLWDASFSEDFLSSITQEDLKSTSANLLKIRNEINKLKNESSKTAQMEGLQTQLVNISQDVLILKIMEQAISELGNEAISNHRPYKLSKITSPLKKSTPKVDSVAMERKRRDEKLWKEAYRVKPEQYKVSSITYVKSGEEK
ncbi:MAG: M56 family metallopeptidase, partial [Bacteroidales bacterium]|nr:M56 family metallopeptidase [Bacteroidales bacterium]